MHTRTLALAAVLALAVGQAYAAAPVRTASEATGVETNYRTASGTRFEESDHTRKAEPGENSAQSDANGVETKYRTASEATGVDNGRLV